MLAKERRLSRIINRESGRTMIFPLDHGVTMGSIDGIVNMKQELNIISGSGCNAVILHKGMLERYHSSISPEIGLLLHLSASTNRTSDSSYKVTVASVEEALALDCDGVSFQMNIGSRNEPEMLRDFGRISGECYRWGMPLLAMVYVRSESGSDSGAEAVGHAVRLAAELGADIVKVGCPNPIEAIAEIAANSPIPVLIAGGNNTSNPKGLLRTIARAIELGSAGTSVGRNVFQCEHQTELITVITRIVHGNIGEDEAVALFDELTKAN